MKIKSTIKLIFSLLIIFIFSSCSKAYLNVYEGKFQVIKPPSITGSQCELKSGSNHSISATGTLGHNETVKLNNVENNKAELDIYSLPDSSSNISYRIIENMFDLNYEYLNKKYICVFGGGGGFAPFPYVYASVGANTKYLNFGVNGLFGLSFDDASYSGKEYGKKAPLRVLGPRDLKSMKVMLKFFIRTYHRMFLEQSIIRVLV